MPVKINGATIPKINCSVKINTKTNVNVAKNNVSAKRRNLIKDTQSY